MLQNVLWEKQDSPVTSQIMPFGRNAKSQRRNGEVRSLGNARMLLGFMERCLALNYEDLTNVS